MAKKRVKRKDLLKKSDEFFNISTKAILFANEHKREFSYLGSAIVLIAVVYLAVFSYFKYVNKKGQEAYNTAYYSMLKNFGVETSQDSYKESEKFFSNVIDDYGMAKVSGLALPELAFIKFQVKKYDEAISRYTQFLESRSENDPYGSLAILAIAKCLEEKGALNEAIANLNQVIERPEGFFREMAMLNLARIYRLQDNHEKSKEILRDFIGKYPSSSFLSFAKSYLK